MERLLALGIHDLLRARFRANSAFELVERNNLSLEQQCGFLGLAGNSNPYGILVPHGEPSLSTVVVDADTAVLFKRLVEPDGLPSELLESTRPHVNTRIAQLVLDGVLEIECQGRFVSGTSAHSQILEAPLAVPRATNLVAALSHNAVRLAQELPNRDPSQIASWLYTFNTVPVSPSWVRRFASPERIDDMLGLRGSSPIRRLLEDSYIRRIYPGWNVWQEPTPGTRGATEDTGTPFKIYISPRPSHLGEAFRAMVKCLASNHVPALKVGRDVYGLLRPDKLMLYFRDFKSLTKASTELTSVLSGCDAQGVPFTATIFGDGLLTWGADPPRNHWAVGQRVGESWRSWITSRLAITLHKASSQRSCSGQAWLYALDRLRLDGVSTNDWVPGELLWEAWGLKS